MCLCVVGEAGLAIRGNGSGSLVFVDLHGRVYRRYIRYHRTGSYAVRHTYPAGLKKGWGGGGWGGGGVDIAAGWTNWA